MKQMFDEPNKDSPPDAAITAFGDVMERAIYEMQESERFKKSKQGFLDALWDDFAYTIIDQMPERIEGFVRDMAQRTVEQMLEGREDQMRRYLGCDGYTGRGREHSVIHGTLFEHNPILLRKKIAQAHADLIRNERIADLEDQVASLVRQVNEKDEIIERQRTRLRDLECPQ